MEYLHKVSDWRKCQAKETRDEEEQHETQAPFTPASNQLSHWVTLPSLSGSTVPALT